MEHFFKTIHITNFKSLKDVTLSDCKRINLLLGKPNVGKSNIIEAIGLFSLPYFEYNQNKSLNQFVRLEHLSELFFDGDKSNNFSIQTNFGDICTVKYINGLNKHSGNFILMVGFRVDKFYDDIMVLPIDIEIDDKFNMNILYKAELSKMPFYSNLSLRIKYYRFIHNFSYGKQDEHKKHLSYLIPPFGVNLIDIIQYKKELKKELIGIFAEYNLKLLFDKGNHSLRIMKETKDGEVFSLPLNSIADTLQRIIFYKTAIASNENSILLFEEPEAHCFPPYITHIAKEIINSKTNQFFIATHSPYILDTFLENARDELAIYMADFKDGQTVIKRLSDAEVNEVYDYGLDLFFNAELFTDEIQH